MDGWSGNGRRVRLLGPVDVVVRDRPRPVNGQRRKALLAILALEAGRVVSTDRLVDVVWPDRAPATATNTLQVHISYLRRLLGGGHAIVARRPGYVLEGDPDTGSPVTDVHLVQGLLDEARRSDDRAARVTRLETAVAVWRGEPLADVAGGSWFDEQAAYLAGLRSAAERALAEARLSVGDHARATPDLERLARLHPLDEALHAQLMLAHYRAGRQGEALATYRRLRDTLADDLGIDPNQEMRELESAILRQDPALVGPAGPAEGATARPGPAARTAPSNLPPDIPAFAGREPELARLDHLLDGGPGATTATTVCVLAGTAGVGKTTLAVHWAHRVAPHFPDGHLYANLRGFSPGVAPEDPATVARRFLEALGEPVGHLPVDPASLLDLYRRVTAGRRILILLDNVRDADQVRPLLPGSAGSLVVTTSRDHLTPLVIVEGARPLLLDLLSPAAARDLLARRLGTHRLAAEPAATEEIVARCSRLPLALAIMAGRAATHPRFALATIVAQLTDTAGSLSAFQGGDPTTDLRAVFSWSYRTLSPPAARLFRLLGLHPGPDFTVPAAASVCGTTPAEAGALLLELSRANLLMEHAYGRYSFHDLLRTYAANLAEATDDDDARRASGERVLDHYLRTAYAADALLHPHFSEIGLPAAVAGVTPVTLVRRSDAHAWFTAENAVLLAAVRQAACCGFEAYAWQLAWATAGFLGRRGRWHDRFTMESVALAAASSIGDPVGQGQAHRSLALACSRLGQHEEATDHLRRALALFIGCGDVAAQAHTYLNLGQIVERRGDHDLALTHSRQALALFQRAGAPAGRAYALNAVGWTEALLGRYRRAIAYCEQALEELRQVDDPQGEADTWDSLGYAYHRLGDHGHALGCYRHALDLFGRVSDRYAEASTYVNIGESHLALADPAAAGTAWRRALAILDDLGHRDAGEVRARVARLSPATERRRAG